MLPAVKQSIDGFLFYTKNFAQQWLAVRFMWVYALMPVILKIYIKIVKLTFLKKIVVCRMKDDEWLIL